MGDLVTVIVPVYNMRGYLERCVLSITGQSHANLQIILVDDGSTDGSGDLCDRMAEKDARIEVIHQPNAGLSGARNAGLDRARGDWISFVDADDFLYKYGTEDLLAAAQTGCDIAIGHYISVDENISAPVPFRRAANTEYMTGYEASICHFGKEADVLNRCWGRLYRAGMWDNVRYPAGKINEDVYVAHALLYRAGRIAIIDGALYAYVQSSGSIMRSRFTLRRLDILDAWQEGVRFFEKVSEPDLLHIARRVYCSRVFDALCICGRELPHEQEALEQLRRRAAEAYREAKPIGGYIDCSQTKALAYRLRFFLGHRFLRQYNDLFVRGRTYI